jgi:hypothetical protein
LLTSAVCKPHWQARLRSAPKKKRGLAALLALLLLLLQGAPARADDPIAQWLKQNEVDGQNNGQNDEVRPDLKALTEQQLQDIFNVGREQADSQQLIERRSEERTPVLYIWLLAIAAGLGAVIGAVKAGTSVRRQLRTLAASFK